MIDERFIFLPNMELNISKLKDIVFRNLYISELGLASHQRLVNKEEYLVDLQNKYTFLSNFYNIYPTPASQIVPIHIDKRGCALNIPIQYTEDSYTVFYEPKDKLEMTYSIPRIYNIIESEMIEVYRYTLTEPVIMNTKLPHGVFGGPRTTRIILSWSISTEYEETKKLVGVL